MRVRFTQTARAVFLDALNYLRRDKPSAARRLLRKVEVSLSRLLRFPDSGRRIPEFPDLPYREVVVPPYRIFYRVDRQVIWVVAVWHGAQLPDSPAEDSGEEVP